MTLSMKTIIKTDVHERMAAREKQMQDLRPAHLAAAIGLRRWVDKNFKADGRLHENGRYHWKPLKASTIKQRRKGKGKGKPQILRDTGRLSADFIPTASKEKGKVVNKTPYAVYHEGGAPKAGLPQRKMFPTRAQGVKIVIPYYEGFLNRKVIEP